MTDLARLKELHRHVCAEDGQILGCDADEDCDSEAGVCNAWDALRDAAQGPSGAEADLDLLRKLASGEGGRRTGSLMRRGLIEVRVTDAGRRLLDDVERAMSWLAAHKKASRP